MKTKFHRLTIIIPARNEQFTIIKTLDKLQRFVKVPCRYLVVDDQSTDETAKLVKNYILKHKNVTLLKTTSDRKGFGNALYLGFLHSQSEYVLPVMADLCDDPETINRMYKKIQEGYDIVAGSRYMEKGRKIGGARLQGFFSKVICLSLKQITGIPTHDISNSFKIYKKNLIKSLNFDARFGVEISMFLTLQAYFKGAKIAEVPTVWQGRTEGKSKFNIFKRTPKYLYIYLWAIRERFVQLLKRQKLITFLQKSYILLTFLFLIALIFRLPLLYTEFMRTPDSIDYINVAENLATGKGYIRSIKSHFFDDSPVFASGNFSRPFFTPFIYSLLLRIKNDYYILQGFNLILGAVNVVLFYILLQKFITKKTAFIGILLIASNPNLIIENRFILSEQIFYFLVLIFFIIYFYLKDSKKKYISLGFIAALGYLTRIEGILLLISVGLTHVTNKKKLVLLSIATISFFLTSIPNFIINYTIFGKPFFTFYAYHFVVLHFYEGVYSFYSPFPSPLVFIQNNFLAITTRIAQNNIENFLSLVGFRFLSTLSIIPLLFLYKRFRPTRLLFVSILPVLLFSLFLFLIVTFTWSVFFQPERHIALTYMFSVFLFFVLTNRIRQLVYVASAITLCIYLIFDVHQLLWIRKSIGSLEETKSQPMYSWIRKNTEKDGIIASRDTSFLYLYTGRPVILIPLKLPNEYDDTAILDEYVKKYQIKYFYVREHDLEKYLTKKGILLRSEENEKFYCVTHCQKVISDI